MRCVAVAILCWAWAAHAATPPPDDLGGTYRIRGAARVDAAAPFRREVAARGDAIVRPGAGGDVRLRIAAMGHACELGATRAADGALTFPPGQACVFDLADPGARGHVEARLRSGRGSLRERHLALDLAFGLTGAVSLRVAPAQVLGVDLPSTWTRAVPVDGGASVRAEGERDESRAAQQP